MTKFASQQELDEIQEDATKIKVREDNPYVYTSSDERNKAKKDANRLLQNDKDALTEFRKNGSIYSPSESETNFHMTWKDKLYDFRHYHAKMKRCPIAGLIMELASTTNTYSNVQWVVARIQPEIYGLDTFKNGEHWEMHSFHFTEEYHPQCFDSFWRKDIPEGHFIDEYGIINIAKEKIAKGIEHETYKRKFYYYLNFWEMWGFRYDEFGLRFYDGKINWDFEANHAKKAERFIEKCLKEGKRQPFPYYDKSKDEYWKLRTPNSWELVLADRLADAKREREEYYLKHMR